MSPPEDEIDWSKTTWDGARREQLYRWRKLSLYEKMRAVEEMGVLAERFAQNRERRGQRSIKPE